MKVRRASSTTMRSGVITRRTETLLGVAQDLVHGDEVAHQALDVVEDRVAGQRDVEHRARERPRRRHELRRLREDLLQPPARDVGEREQAQRLARRRAVDDHAAEAPVLVVALDLQQAEELVEAGRDRELLGADAVHAALEQQLAQPVLDRGPVALHLVLRGHLLGPQALADLRRLAAHGGLQRVGQRVRRVGREDDGVDPARGDAPRRRSGDRGLADPALARVEDRPGRHGDASAYSARPHRDPPGHGADVARRGRPRAGAPPARRACAGGRRRRGGRSRSAPSA